MVLFKRQILMNFFLRILFFFIFFLLRYNNFIFSQESDTLVIEHQKKSIKPTTDFDQRFSFIKKNEVNIWGQKVGVLINEKIKIGVGGYFLKDKLKSNKIYNNSKPEFYVNRNIEFGTAYIEPFLFRKNYWELSVPFEMGFGKTTLKDYLVSNDVLVGHGVKYFFPTGIGLSLSLKLPVGKTYKPFRWIGINFLAGYRYDIAEHIYNTDYDGLFWSVSGAIFLDRIFDDYKTRESKNKK